MDDTDIESSMIINRNDNKDTIMKRSTKQMCPTVRNQSNKDK